MSACHGTCCAAFYIGYTLTELREGVNPEHPDTRLRQAEQIAGMVIPLTPKEAKERNPGLSATWAHRGHHYTCRHWDEDSRLCRIYEDRPDMCRGFPYGKRCPFGCEEVGTPMEELRGERDTVKT